MIQHEGKEYVCHLDLAMDFVRGKWKAVILCHIADGPIRFLHLQRRTKGISQKVLNEKLKELEKDGLIQKKVFAEVPPRVEYRLTDLGEELFPALQAMQDWAMKHFPSDHY